MGRAAGRVRFSASARVTWTVSTAARRAPRRPGPAPVAPAGLSCRVLRSLLRAARPRLLSRASGTARAVARGRAHR